MTDKRSELLAPNSGPSAAIVIAPTSAPKDPVATYLMSLQSKESRRTQLSALRAVAALLGTEDPRAVPWGMITYDHALAMRMRLGETLAPATAQRYFAAFKGVLREAWRLRILPSEEWQRIDDVTAPKGESAETGRALTIEEIRSLFNATGDHYLGRRDAALIAVSIFGGLRRFEVRGLMLEDLTPTGELRIRGKGRKERVVRLSKLAIYHTRRWLEVRSDEPGPLLYGTRRGTPIGYSTISKVQARCAEKAGIPAFTPHDLRRTFVTRILEMTGDLAIAQKAAGHSLPETTVRYDKRGAEASKVATERLDEGI